MYATFSLVVSCYPLSHTSRLQDVFSEGSSRYVFRSTDVSPTMFGCCRWYSRCGCKCNTCRAASEISDIKNLRVNCLCTSLINRACLLRAFLYSRHFACAVKTHVADIDYNDIYNVSLAYTISSPYYTINTTVLETFCWYQISVTISTCMNARC